MRLIALVMAAMLSVVSTAAVVTADEVAEEGKPPPLFALPDEHGTVFNLADYVGRPTILYFTHNMCHYCTQIIAFLKRAHAQYEGSDLAILTLNVWASDEKFILRYKETLGLPFTMLAAKDERASLGATRTNRQDKVAQDETPTAGFTLVDAHASRHVDAGNLSWEVFAVATLEDRQTVHGVERVRMVVTELLPHSFERLAIQ